MQIINFVAKNRKNINSVFRVLVFGFFRRISNASIIALNTE